MKAGFWKHVGLGALVSRSPKAKVQVLCWTTTCILTEESARLHVSQKKVKCSRDPHFMDRSSWPRCRRFVRRSLFFPTPSSRSHASLQTRCPDWLAKQVVNVFHWKLRGYLKKFLQVILGLLLEVSQLKKKKSHDPRSSTWGPTFNVIVTFSSVTIRNLQWPQYWILCTLWKAPECQTYFHHKPNRSRAFAAACWMLNGLFYPIFVHPVLRIDCQFGIVFLIQSFCGQAMKWFQLSKGQADIHGLQGTTILRSRTCPWGGKKTWIKWSMVLTIFPQQRLDQMNRK